VISQLANYSPIPLLARFSKLFEILMFRRITDNASHKLRNSIFKAWNKKMYVSGMFYDLVKVFQCM